MKDITLKKTAEEILISLRDRSGFDHFWDDIDSDIKDEILLEWQNIIKSNQQEAD